MTNENSITDELFDDNANNLTVHQRRDLVLSVLKRKSRVRTIFADVSVEELKEILERLEGVLEEKIVEDKERAEKDAARIEKSISILREMEELGVDIETLKKVKSQQELTRSGAKVKYVKDGSSWSGQGRRPAAFKGLSDIELEQYRKPRGHEM